MLVSLLVSTVFAGGFTTCSVTDASAGAHATWQVLTRTDGDGMNDARTGYTSATARVATAFGDTEQVDLCPAGDALAGVDLPVRRLGLIAIEVDPELLGEGSCPAISWARGEGVVEGSAQVDPRGLAATLRARSTVRLDADNVATISADAGAGARFTSNWQYRSNGPNTRLDGTIEVSLAEAESGARLNLPGFAKVEAWDGRVDAWLRVGDRYEHVSGMAPMTLRFSTVAAGRGGGFCGGGSASMGAVATDSDGSLETEATLAFAVVTTGTTDAADRTPHTAPAFDLCGCQ